MRTITLTAFLVVVFFVGSVAGYIVKPSQDPVSTYSDYSLIEPPILSVPIKSQKDVLDDLKSMGCMLIPSDELFTRRGYFTSPPGVIVIAGNYTDFRRVAFNTKIVFYNSTTIIYDNPFLACITVYQGLIVGWEAYLPH